MMKSILDQYGKNKASFLLKKKAAIATIIMKFLLRLVLFCGGAWAASRETPPAGSIVVAKSGGNYNTVSAILNISLIFN
jgi:hypothetical protein